MAKRDCSAACKPIRWTFGKYVNTVVNTTRNIKFLAVWIPCKSAEGIRHRQGLNLARRKRCDIEDENMLIKSLWTLTVVAAREYQQGSAVGAEHGVDRLAEGHIAAARHAWIEWSQNRVWRRIGCDRKTIRKANRIAREGVKAPQPQHNGKKDTREEFVSHRERLRQRFCNSVNS